MREPTELEKKQYQRLQEIFAIARNRYLRAGGNPKRAGGILNGQDYLSLEEKQEIIKLGKQVFPLGRTKIRV